VKREIWEKGKGRGNEARAKPPTLNAAVSQVLACRGAYVVFCRTPMVTKTIEARQSAIAAAIREAAGNLKAAAAIEFYDGNKIASWVNRHYHVVAWVHHVTHGLALDRVQTMESWGLEPSFSAGLIPSDAARYVVSIGAGGGELGTIGPAELPFVAARKQLRGDLAEPKRIARLMGSSDFGKSRFAYKVFHSCRDLADEPDTNSILFANYA